MTFGARLRDRRKALRMSGGELGAALGEELAVKKQTVSHWETGRYEPSLDQIAKLCEVLNVSADWLLLGADVGTLGPKALEFARTYQRMQDASPGPRADPGDPKKDSGSK